MPTCIAGAQGAPVLGLDSFPHAVASIDSSIAFYSDAFGYVLLSTVPAVTNGKVGANVYDRELQALMDVGGAYYRIATLKRPGDTYPLRLFELVNNQTIVMFRGERQGTAQVTDIGGSSLRLEVADVVNTSRGLREKYLGDVLTLDSASETPIETFAIRDDEGFLVQLVSAPSSETQGRARRAGISVTTADLERKLHFYRDLLGFTLKTGSWEDDRTTVAALGAPAGRLRRTQGVVPGTDVGFEILEFADVKQRRFYPPVMGQPGVGWVSLLVRDLDKLMEVFVDERVRVVSTGVQPVDFGDSRRVVVRDPDGVLVELIEPEAVVSDVGR